jgi:hypothetical protein
MVLGFNLPDWKGAFQESLRDYVKVPLETKARELQEQLTKQAQEFQAHHRAWQKAVIAILLAGFLVGVIGLAWSDKND